MARKSQHSASYQRLKTLLQALRVESGLTQVELASMLKRPQSWVYKSETEIRRVDLTEFVQWAEACGIDPVTALKRYLRK